MSDCCYECLRQRFLQAALVKEAFERKGFKVHVYVRLPKEAKTAEEISQHLEAQRVTYNLKRRFPTPKCESDVEHSKRIANLESVKWVPLEVYRELQKENKKLKESHADNSGVKSE